MSSTTIRSPRLDQLVFGKLAECGFKRLASLGRVAEAEARYGVRIEPARRQIRPRFFAIRPSKVLHKPRLRGCRDIVQRALLLGRLRGAGIGRGDFQPGLGSQLLDRVHEGKPALVGHPADGIAVGAAAEAVVKTLDVVDGEAWGLLVVKRAAGLEFMPRFGQPCGA